MFGGRRKIFVVVVLLLFAASAASASPTVISGSSLRIMPPSPDRATGVIPYNIGSNVVRNRMREFGKAFLKPPLSNSSTAGERYLPAVPPALAMVLSGFVCISLIRDRRVWLAVFTFAFGLGQMGINALPELTSRLSRRVHAGQLIEPTLLAAHPAGDDYYPESYNQQTRYTGLLHHLAGIPWDTSVFTNKAKVTSSFSPRWNVSAGKDTRVSQHAIVSALSSLSTTFDCLVSGTRQFICFTPAFIFNLIPRGPPVSTLKTLL